jgi:ribosomal protein L24E
VVVLRRPSGARTLGEERCGACGRRIETGIGASIGTCNVMRGVVPAHPDDATRTHICADCGHTIPVGCGITCTTDDPNMRVWFCCADDMRAYVECIELRAAAYRKSDGNDA